MKFVAKKDFSNPRYLSLAVPDAIHPKHVHKGARFNISGDLPYASLPQSDQEKVKQLLNQGCIVEASTINEGAIKKIDLDVAAAKKTADERKKKSDSQVTLLDQVQKLTAALEALAGTSAHAAA